MLDKTFSTSRNFEDVNAEIFFRISGTGDLFLKKWDTIIQPYIHTCMHTYTYIHTYIHIYIHINISLHLSSTLLPSL